MEKGSGGGKEKVRKRRNEVEKEKRWRDGECEVEERWRSQGQSGTVSTILSTFFALTQDQTNNKQYYKLQYCIHICVQTIFGCEVAYEINTLICWLWDEWRHETLFCQQEVI